jgi:uncharacterized protein YgiM (DUF1202 family)
MATVSAEQLQKLQEFSKFTAEAKNILGDITVQYELQKNSILRQLLDQQTGVEALEKQITEEFGNVSVNLTTGEVTPQETANVDTPE